MLLHPLPTCTDAGPDLCTFCTDLRILRSDLCTLHLWCYPSINKRKYSTCTHGGGYWLQLALVAFFLQPLAQTLLAGGGATHCNLHWWSFSSTHWHTYSTWAQATCIVWWWSVVVVVACGCGGGGGCRYGVVVIQWQ